MDQKLWDGSQLDRHSPVPLYQQLSDVIADLIGSKKLQPGDHLPSENDLISMFGVSRFVVRQTLNSLSRQGLIVTEHGRGSFVAAIKINKPLDVLQSYHAAMRKAGMEIDVRILNKEIILPPSDIARKLNLKPNEKVLLLERVAYSNDAPMNLLISHIAPGTWGLDKLMEFTDGSLYQFLANSCGIHLNHSRSSIEVIFASEYESRTLKLARGAVMLQILGVSYEKSGIPVENSRVVYPANLFGFQFESHISEESGESSPMMISER
ncbi:MAG: GntR family transcriptional regulator [Anaerolineaceae bacterium]|nr:GntR family transcriptional regulator [Anaerolineaceae bacterium]